MFLCDTCHPSECHAPHLARSRGPCESCRQTAVCSDCHYSPPMSPEEKEVFSQILDDLDAHTDYMLSEDGLTWEKVPIERFMDAERMCGFVSKFPGRPATASFSGTNHGKRIHGRSEYHPPTQETP